LVRFGLFIAFLVFLFSLACPLHGTREQYTCLERSKVRSNRVAGAPLTMPQPGDFFTCNTCKHLRLREGSLRGPSIPLARNKTTAEKSRTALCTAETFILLVDCFRIALSASSPNGRFVFGYLSIIHFIGTRLRATESVCPQIVFLLFQESPNY